MESTSYKSSRFAMKRAPDNFLKCQQWLQIQEYINNDKLQCLTLIIINLLNSMNLYIYICINMAMIHNSFV